MLQNPCKTLGFKKNMVYKIPPGGGGKPYPASGLRGLFPKLLEKALFNFDKLTLSPFFAVFTSFTNSFS